MSEANETVDPPKSAPDGTSPSGSDKKGDKKRIQKRVPRDKACYNCGEVSFSRAALDCSDFAISNASADWTRSSRVLE